MGEWEVRKLTEGRVSPVVSSFESCEEIPYGGEAMGVQERPLRRSLLDFADRTFWWAKASGDLVCDDDRLWRSLHNSDPKQLLVTGRSVYDYEALNFIKLAVKSLPKQRIASCARKLVHARWLNSCRFHG